MNFRSDSFFEDSSLYLKTGIEQSFSQLPYSIKFKKDVPMKRYTSFKVGGPADYFVQPTTLSELIAIISSMRLNNIPFTIIGGGTNLLVKDNGIRGVVVSLIRMKNEISIEPYVLEERFMVVSASAGVALAALCRKTIKLGLEDLSFAAGIPGTLGGAIIMNAGTGAGTISDLLISIDILDRDNNIKNLDRSQLIFSHRTLKFLPPFDLPFKPTILRASFLLSKGSKERVQKSWASLIDKRRATQPHGFASAGCFFKNPDIQNLESNSQILSAGQLIDMAGLKKKRVGDAMVSDKHANFILNLGSATASQILDLKNLVKDTVFQKFGVHLVEEVIIQGE
ncbi:MAG: UDP-N-acetylmuramate dehydrogenase [Desulfamplus sp.]|nr:UDP-N-acetylmuramate dehydrogenase [Desulfamplus sp.]